MKILKLIFGLVILWFSGVELASASMQIGTFWNPGILIGLFIMSFAGTWLISSGHSKEKMKILSMKFGIYYLIGMVVIIVGFVSEVGSSI